jgi:thymidylate synthase
MSREERKHMSAVAALGCLICGRFAELHHIRRDPKDRQHFGLSQKATNFQVIPLCQEHHRTGGIGVAYHASPREWERIHGNEVDLLAQVLEKLGKVAA